MADYLARVELPQVSGLPEDTIVNNFTIHDNEDEIGTVGPLAVTTALDHFYNQTHTVAGTARRVSEFLSPALSRTSMGATVKYYEITGALDGDPVGSPAALDHFTLGAAVGTSLPAEIAAVLTLRGQDWNTVAVEAPDGPDAGVALDRPKQRHTGRVFLGPLGSNAIQVDASQRARVSDIAREAVLNACSTLQEELTAQTPQKAWVVWSRKDAVVRRVVRGEIDNAFDVQRRRGEAATVRGATGAL